MVTSSFLVCVICGKAPLAGENLTTEHIIPFALGGNETLPKSVCKRCAHKTSRAEAAVLRGALFAFRTKIGLPTRSNERPKELPLFCINEDEKRRISVPIGDYPVVLPLPRYGEPGIFSGVSARVPSKPWFFAEEADFGVLSRDYGVNAFATMALDTFAFAQMLAKIGHVWLTKVLGFGGFEPLLARYIISNDSPKLFNFVGSEDQSNISQGKVKIDHTLGVSKRVTPFGTLISCDIQLFRNLGAPLYRVIAGRELGNVSKVTTPVVSKSMLQGRVRAMIVTDGVARHGFAGMVPDSVGKIAGN
jgi:hypothetical protein